MSFNPLLDRQAIQSALRTLGTQVRQPATVYLFGGTALILQGVRAGATKDLDLWSYDNFPEVDAAVQHLKRRQVSIDFLDPALFLPLPPGWQIRSTYAGTYGAVQIYYLDPYTIALTKINRSQPQDITDIQLLASQKLILRDELMRLYQLIQPHMGTGIYLALDPAVYDARFQAVLQAVTW